VTRTATRDLGETAQKLLVAQTAAASAADQHAGQAKVYEAVLKDLEGRAKALDAQAAQCRDDWSREK
jgi:hypothetical protein